MLGSLQAEAMLAGIAAMVVKRVMQGSSRSVQRMRGPQGGTPCVDGGTNRLPLGVMSR